MAIHRLPQRHAGDRRYIKYPPRITIMWTCPHLNNSHPQTPFNALLPHGAFLERELRWKMHTGCQPKRVCIKHRVERVEDLAYSTIYRAVRIPSLRGRRGLHWRLTLHTHGRLLAWRMRLLLEGLGVWTRTSRIVAVLVVEHIRLRIVLLFCTHGINLGRT